MSKPQFTEDGKVYELMPLEEISKLTKGSQVKILVTGSVLENFNIYDAIVIELDMADKTHPARIYWEYPALDGSGEILERARWCSYYDWQIVYDVQILKEVSEISEDESVEDDRSDVQPVPQNHRLIADAYTPAAIYGDEVFLVVQTLKNETNSIVLQNPVTGDIVVAGSPEVQLLNHKMVYKIQNLKSL